MEKNLKRIILSRKNSLTIGFICLVIVLSGFLSGFKFSDQDYFFKINKGIDIIGRVYKEITMNYVDEVDPEKFIEAGIDGLLGTLDPYTNFISEKEADEVELITAGKYGGIGVSIGIRDGNIIIISLMEGYSAQRQGILPGDKILEIDNKSVVGMKPENIRSLTRGEPGTEVHLKIDREGEPKPLDFVLVREEIQLKNIPYSDFVNDGIGYIRLERFSRGAGDELRLALKDLKLKGNLRGIILDLRDNPGGLLDAAVDVAGKFLHKGSLIVSTRGRQPESEKKYFVAEEPIFPDLPMIVLVNRQSASASEIVAGAIQDLDRGIVLGTRTFGKGLVQTITPLLYNTQLKITTAKYYTPSGRCIQEIDYAKRDQAGIFTTLPDSLKRKFKTLKGRLELEAGGIQPDTVVDEMEHSSYFKELNRKSMFFKFATRYALTHKDSSTELQSDSLFQEFQQFLNEQKFTYQDEIETKLKELCDAAEKCKSSPTILAEMEKLRQLLQEDKSNSVIKHRDEIMSTLKPEVMSRYKGERGKIEESLKIDSQVKAAISLLESPKEYSRRLSMLQ
ncbi:MAG: S41 family peptidase [Bacteroidota bacterium]|nr:S41 family peptidase [Bacteroidota bacterium]